ncbi:MAG: histidine--tRNA ligase, partial [Candidatus Methanomethylophilaceae archaeon]|nr:histidine--tRNA ligase [Candidatus Methanomethylophilaceae archaeon]
KYASSVRAKYAVIVGAKELEQDSVTLRDMATGDQQLVKISELPSKIA